MPIKCYRLSTNHKKKPQKSNTNNARPIMKTPGFKYQGIETRETIAGVSWTFHQLDADPWPSVPHGEAWRNGVKLKLDYWTGNIYTARDRKWMEKVPSKTMDKLRKNKKMKTFALKAIREHRVKYPYHDFYTPEEYQKSLRLPMIGCDTNNVKDILFVYSESGRVYIMEIEKHL